MNDLPVIKYPYLGYSSNLIEYFMIIGYEKNYIYNEILPNQFYPNNEQVYHELTVINSISSNSEIDILDNDMIIKLVYPKQPQIISTFNLSYDPALSSVIFFSNADALGINSKVPFHGCGLLFYENFVANSSKILIPKAFCIISQFPYFQLFNSLNKEILNLYKNGTEVPIEIILYNIINLIPSPINFSLNLAIFPKDQKNVNTRESTMSNISFGQNPGNNFNSFNSYTTNHNGIAINPINNPPREFSTTQRSYSMNMNCYPISQLSGYPVLDWNISEIFNILPINTVIEILIFNFLEFDMLFFSKNIEILNFVMYIIAILNYPCNDSIYQWHILSVPPEELINSDNSQFAGKPWAAMLGVNSSYTPLIDNSKAVDSNFIVDIDNKSFFLKNTENSEDNQKANQLLVYIRKITKDYSVQSLFLQKIIKNLQKELEIITKQVISNPGTFTTSSRDTLTNESQANFYETSDRLKILNKNIQEAFYDFILNILIIFYNNYFLNSSFDRRKSIDKQNNSNFFIYYNEDTSKFSKEELVFYYFFKASNKYNNYVLNFIMEFKCINLYKIPLIFSEEFIYLKKNSEDKVLKSRFFEIIQNFYNENNTSNKATVVSFQNFYKHYETHLKQYIFEQIDHDGIISTSIKALAGGTTLDYKNFDNKKLDKNFSYFYSYNIIDIDRKILFKYLNYINNLETCQKEEIFPFLKWKSCNTIKTIKFGDIINSIERNLISHKIIKSDYLILYSLILVFIVTRPICNFNESITHLKNILELIDSKSFFMRKYIYLIFSYYTTKHTVEDGLKHCINDFKKCNYISRMCRYMIINNLRIKIILPNEQLMNLFEIFFSAEKEVDDSHLHEDLHNEEVSMSEEELDRFNLFLQYHFCIHGTKKADYFLKMAENISHDGDLFLECCPNSEKKTCLVFKFDFSEKRYNTEIFSPLKLFNLCNRLHNDYLSHMAFEKIDRELLDKVIVNLIFYCKNWNMNYRFLLKFLNY
jgi:hypothetical protein